MGFLDMIGWPRDPVAEKRMITEIPGIERPGANLLQVYGLGNVELPSVTVDSALTVPAVLAAVSFLSRSLAALPLHVYRNTARGAERISGGLQTLIHEAPNREWTSFKLRQHFWQQVFTTGRGLLWIERSGSNITGLYPVNPTKAKISRDSMGRSFYEIGGKVYPAADIIDVPFMLKADGVAHYGPVVMGAPAIQLALAMNNYGSRFFAGGGVPPLALEGPLPQGPEAMKRAMADINRAIESAKAQEKPIFPMPPGHKLTQVGFDPDKGQMTEARRFAVEEIARVYQIPPVFLQDLTHGTYSNSEQQDLHLVKHLIAQWARALEQEFNLKLFGQRNGGRFVDHNLDGLMRGDFVTRMNGLAQAVQTAILTPNEARALENRPAMANGDDLMIQGATVRLGSQDDNSPEDTTEDDNSTGDAVTPDNEDESA
ncbi:phage portal protein [Novosphingobium sp. NPDC080210]|uniref:phage portal protein n=1 Tax=Novosphingobium sp. NPDC080210 TaxID=3390596 RepID=UPI003CFE11E2